jgi:hypothetical protein
MSNHATRRAGAGPIGSRRTVSEVLDSSFAVWSAQTVSNARIEHIIPTSRGLPCHACSSILLFAPVLFLHGLSLCYRIPQTINGSLTRETDKLELDPPFKVYTLPFVEFEVVTDTPFLFLLH